MQRGNTIIPKTVKKARLAENAALFDFELSEEEMTAIDGLNKNRRYNDPGSYAERFFNVFYPIYE